MCGVSVLETNCKNTGVVLSNVYLFYILHTQVNKSVGSPGSAASTVNLLPGTTLNSVSRQGRHSLQPSSLEPNANSMVIYSHRARRHSYCDTTRDGIEDYLNFCDCTDSLSMTSSNKEPSPVPCLDNVERDSSESREKEEERFVKGHSALSSGMSDCLTRISDSASLDNEEDDGSKVAEIDTSLLVPSRKESPNISESSSIIVPTCRIQVGQDICLCSLNFTNMFPTVDRFCVTVLVCSR